MSTFQSSDDIAAAMVAKDLAQYRLMKWTCEVPPVCTILWGERDWIRWIKRTGSLTGEEDICTGTR